MPQGSSYTRRDAAERIAAILQKEGFSGVTPEMVLAFMEAWIAGARRTNLPEDKIGKMTWGILAIVDATAPGGLASLKP